MDVRQLGMGEVLTATMAQLRERAGLSFAVIAAIAGAYSLLDLLGASSASAFLSVAVSVTGQYLFAEHLLADRMPTPLPSRRYGALFLASLLAGLGAVVGTLLLVLPGILLIARWSISTPFLVEGGMTATEALKASWQATAKSWPGLFGLVLLAGIALFGALIAILLVAEAAGLSEKSPVVIISTNLVVGGFTVIAWLFAVAVYKLVLPDGRAITEVFA